MLAMLQFTQLSDQFQPMFHRRFATYAYNA